MKIGIPKEIKEYEFRVGATPAMVKAFVDAGHKVAVETNAGAKIGFADSDYQAAGATIVPTAADAYTNEMIVKVKEPQSSEFAYMHEGQILFCYLHLAPDPEQTRQLLEKKVVGIAYETVTDDLGQLPLLIPMSEIAGRIAIQAGAFALEMKNGGKGILLGGVPGVKAADVTVIGGGFVGLEAARMAMGLGANVTIIDKNINRLRQLDVLFGPNLKTMYSSSLEIQETIVNSDLIIGAVLIPGKTAPKLVTRKHLRAMEAGSVFVDVAIDQGGCSETSRPTTHGMPVYEEEGVIHYCVTNMPGACAKTSTMALTHATMDYALKIANKGYQRALTEHEGLRQGLNVCHGHVTNAGVANDLDYEYVEPAKLLS